MKKIIIIAIIVLIPVLFYSYNFLVKNYIESEIKKANYCEKDGDCSRVSTCVWPCGASLVNTRETERIRGLVRFQASYSFTCSLAECKPTTFIPPKCVENKCGDKR